MNTRNRFFLPVNNYCKGNNLNKEQQLPLTKGTEAGRYFPSIYLRLSGIGTFLYLGKSLTSSGWETRSWVEGFRIWGGWMNGSFKCASPSIKAYEIILYLAAFLNIDAILFNI